jgi:peptide/nickel transport system permease protein
MIMFIATALLYAMVMFTPAEVRAELYVPPNTSRMTPEQYERMIDRIIERYHLDAPYPVQYFYYIANLIQGNWGYSPTLQQDVAIAIVARSPVTAELAFYSILAFIPLGLLSGVIAAIRRNKPADHSIRLIAYIATTLPPFILALILLAFFYVNLRWFAPERLNTYLNMDISAASFHLYTGFLTIDGLLNHRPDITLDAFRHLAMPVFTLSFAHWATLTRITRTTMIEESQQDYVVAARARGLKERRIVWRHMLRNAIAPSLTSSILSAAALLTGVFVVEIIFNFHGISGLAVASMQHTPDAPAALGFTIYSVLVVVILMAVLDLLQVLINPQMSEKEEEVMPS